MSVAATLTSSMTEDQLEQETQGWLTEDWANPSNNEFWAVSQFTIKGPHHTAARTSFCLSTACRWYCWN